MDTLFRCVKGGFHREELKLYLTAVSVYFWGLIFLAWLSFPADHKFSIMTHTFSFLGSFEAKHNPQWWWIFSIAMVSWGILMVPLVFYYHRRFVAISRGGAVTGTLLLLLGCAGISMVGIFPDASPVLFGSVRWTDIHEKAALMVAAGFIFGLSCHGVLLLKDRFFMANNPHGLRFDHGKLFWPYLMWSSVLAVSAYFLIRWEFVYPQWKAAAMAEGRDIGSSWSASLGTRYSFPLWEQAMIYTLYIFLVWFALVLPANSVPTSSSPGSSPARARTAAARGASRREDES